MQEAATKQYKYRIKELVEDRYPGREERGEAVKKMAEAVACTPNHVRKVWNYKLEDESEVRLAWLVVWADMLDTQVSDLLSEEYSKKVTID